MPSSCILSSSRICIISASISSEVVETLDSSLADTKGPEQELCSLQCSSLYVTVHVPAERTKALL